MANKAKQKKEKKKKKKLVDNLHEGTGQRVAATKKQFKGIAIGRKFVKKAGQWLNYKCFDTENKSDEFEWEG